MISASFGMAALSRLAVFDMAYSEGPLCAVQNEAIPDTITRVNFWF